LRYVIGISGVPSVVADPPSVAQNGDRRRDPQQALARAVHEGTAETLLPSPEQALERVQTPETRSPPSSPCNFRADPRLRAARRAIRHGSERRMRAFLRSQPA
jgi:hypothetical protein